MELIYTDANRNDIGYLPKYNLDIAFGNSENDFRLNVNINDNCMKQGYFFYAEGTEYGGIVDSIAVDNSTNTVSYYGRSFHGILNSKVIEPEQGQDYLIMDGEASEIISELIERCDLQSLVEVVINDGFELVNYQFKRYTLLYDGIRDMLTSIRAKLKITYSNQKIRLEVMPATDYSNDEELDSAKISMRIEKNYKPVNHLVCLGSGDLKDRAVIHLFTDEGGEVQPYATVENPKRDSEYILDKRNQVFFGTEDRSEVFDYGSAQVAENYIPIKSKPSNWNDKYTQFYKQTDEYFEQLERTYSDDYVLLEEKPYDWNVNFTKYYKKENNNYIQLDTGRKYIDWEPVTSEPRGWKKYYGEYYYYWTDGVEEEWRPIPADQKLKIYEQFTKPTDWASNKGNYYVEVVENSYQYKFKKKRNGVWQTWYTEYPQKIKTFKKPDYICEFVEKFENKRYYMKISDFVKEPRFNAKMSDFKSWSKSKFGPFYTGKSKSVAPPFSKYAVLRKVEMFNPVPFTPNLYYDKTVKENIPGFVSGKYYEKAQDRYADLVNYGIERLRDYWNQDVIEVNINFGDYQVGDIIKATESITGISVVSSITKKIVRVSENGHLAIEYEIGGI